MLPKHIKTEKTPDHTYRLLALYICGHTEKNPDEKMLASWFSNCEGETFEENLMEVEAVQDLNTRALGAKTYHLMVSFRPEDEDKLTPERLQAIDEKIAKALGLEQHQRCCGIHKNTNNLHMHVGYNLIHPHTFNINDPHRDYYKLAKVCREIEQEYGLAVDRGLEEGAAPVRTNVLAQTMEAQTGQESFDSYVQRHKAALMTGLAAAGSWPDVHKAFAEYGIGIKPSRGRKGGLVLHDLHNKKYHITASSLDRSTSGPAMEKRFGSYEVASKLAHVQEIERYSKLPLQKEPNRGKLYEKYLAAVERKKAAYAELDELKADEQQRRAEIKAKWTAKRQELNRNTKMTAKDRWGLIQKTYLLQKDELAATGAERQEKHKRIREQYPFSSWTDYLKNEAGAGNETALDILRSKKIVFEADQAAPAPRKKIDNSQAKEDIINNPRLATKDKKKFLAVARLEEKIGEKCKVSITPTGVLIIRFESGVTIRDTGKEVFFDKASGQARHIADEYAKLRWGKMSREKDNSFALVLGRQIFTPKKEQGMER